MRHRLQTKAGKKRYALRKQTPEPVFGIIKAVIGFRQFMLRGLDKVTVSAQYPTGQAPVYSPPQAASRLAGRACAARRGHHYRNGARARSNYPPR